MNAINIEKKQYTSLDAIIKDHNFIHLIEKLVGYENDKDRSDINILKENIDGYPSRLDELLFSISKNFYKKDKDKKNIIEYNENIFNAVDKLLEMGANPNAVFKAGVTPLMLACETNSVKFVEQLIKNQKNPGDIMLGDNRGCKSFMFAVLKDATEIINLLVKEYNFDINAKYILFHNKTALHLACLNAQELSVNKLIELNANPLIKDNKSLLAAEIIPAFDSEVDNDGDYSKETLEKWDRIFDVMCNYIKLHENKKEKIVKIPKKINF